MGGSVSDVKAYFFGLKNAELNELFSVYRRKYGASKEAYARQAFSKWRSRATQMSGLVAKRLFDLLPPRMPIATKLELAGNVWRHFGPSSTHRFTIGPNANVELVIGRIHEKLTAAIQDHNIPENVKNRFDWLAAGDVSVKEQLLNYFRQLDRQIAAENLHEQIPVLQAQMRDHGAHTGSVHTKIQIDKHSVEIWIDPKLDSQFREGRLEPKPSTRGASGTIWFLVLVAVVIAIIYLSHR